MSCLPKCWVRGDPAESDPADTLHLLRLVRLTLLAPAIQGFAGLAGMAESPLPFVNDRFVAMLDHYIDEIRERIELIVPGGYDRRAAYGS